MSETTRARVVLALCSLGFFLVTLDILIINVALPSIDRELGGGTTAQQWVIDGYTLMFAALLLFAGNLADRIGAKRSLGCGIAVFLLSSIGCALAPSTGSLIGFRFVQGAAAAVMLPATMALIRDAFPDPRHRAHALGIWAVGGAVAGAVGPLLGGLLTATGVPRRILAKFDPPGMKVKQYNEIAKALDEAGLGAPAERLYQSATARETNSASSPSGKAKKHCGPSSTNLPVSASISGSPRLHERNL